MKINAILFISIFFIIYGPVLDTSLGEVVDLSFFTCIVLMLFGALRKSVVFSNRFIYQLVTFLLIIMALCLANAVLLDTYGVQYALRPILRPVRVIPVIFGIAVLCHYVIHENPRFSMYSFVYIIYLAILLHALIMTIQFFNVDFRNFIYQYTTAKYVLEIYQATRMAGLTGAGGAQLSIVQSCGLILGVFLFVQTNSSSQKFIVFLTFPLIILSVFMAGRSGFITAFLFCPLYLIYLSALISLKRAVVTSMGVLVSLLATFSLLWFLFYDILSQNVSFVSAFQRIFDSFIAYNQGEGVKVNTVSRLSEMFIIPDESLHLLFGKASYLNNNTTYDIDTDIGYFRLLWGYGILGSIFHYLFYIFAITKIICCSYLSKAEKSLPIILLFLILFFNSKEILVFSRINFQITMLVLFFAFFINWSRKSNYGTHVS
ncbi:hypothetical protein [Shewanella sp. FDAARGOS_354]|uniref:hypothetical protein n=1 Tax=Shewanella sp. FDAARGOS_354 TaxID=1930557 RepID=UPI000D20954E|nr:hypothetical protein [Shewanella sp. FDAARGOS_354]ASF13678.2 hypothetical protein CEQ32_00490 [Shewanella sp. FDAARGOS_354]